MTDEAWDRMQAILDDFRRRDREHKAKKNSAFTQELEIRRDTGTYWDERLGRELTEEEVKQRKRQQQRGYGFDR